MPRIIDTSTLDEHSIARLNPRDKLWVYNGLDCLLTHEIFTTINAQLDNTTRATYEFSKSLQACVLEMNMRGVAIDFDERRRLINEFTDDIARLEAQLDRIITDGVGTSVNWRSPKQLGELLYDILRVPEKRARNTQGRRVRTTNRDALEKLSNYFIAEPIVAHILALRDLAKRLDFLNYGIDSDGRLRTSYNVAGTNTGRLSSAGSDFGTGGNLQNVERRMRRIIVADAGQKFCNIDLEQADSRNVGARCWTLFHSSHGHSFAGSYLDACESGDLHTQVTRMCKPTLGWADDPKSWRATADQIAYRDFSHRDMSKRLGHGTNFRGTPPTMEMHTKTPRRIIEAFQRDYFAAFPCIPAWHKWIDEELVTTRSLTTLLGRRRGFFGNPRDAAVLREATAFEPQSLTADEVDTAMIRIWREGRVQVLLQTHDSILFQYHEEEEDEILPWALGHMRVMIDIGGGRDFYVPAEAKVGWNAADKSENNPDGLSKWKGGDERRRQIPAPDRISIGDF